MITATIFDSNGSVSRVISCEKRYIEANLQDGETYRIDSGDEKTLDEMTQEAQNAIRKN